MFTTDNYGGVYANVKESLGEFWHDFDIDEIISRAYEFNGENYERIAGDEKFWEIVSQCDKCVTEGVTEKYDYRKPSLRTLITR